MKNSLTVVGGISVLLFVFYSIFFWDYHVSKYLFKQYCEEEGRVGLFIYEKVALPDEYFMPYPKDKDEIFNLSNRFVIDEDLVFDKTKLEEKYTFTYRKVVSLSDIGPINSLETSVFRRSDNKLLGKAVSLTNHLGSWIDSSKFGKKVEHCPTGYDERGLSNSGKLHLGLIKEIFYKR